MLQQSNKWLIQGDNRDAFSACFSPARCPPGGGQCCARGRSPTLKIWLASSVGRSETPQSHLQLHNPAYSAEAQPSTPPAPPPQVSKRTRHLTRAAIGCCLLLTHVTGARTLRPCSWEPDAFLRTCAAAWPQARVLRWIQRAVLSDSSAGHKVAVPCCVSTCSWLLQRSPAPQKFSSLPADTTQPGALRGEPEGSRRCPG